MNVTVDVIHDARDTQDIPPEEDFRHWVNTAMALLASRNGKRALAIRIIDEAESASLNTTYRGRQGATNVLSFPASPELPSQLGILGDLAICAPVVAREAREQGKAVRAHWAHMTVHGVLHLNGYDHEEPAAADEMENLEILILRELNFPDPYEEH